MISFITFPSIETKNILLRKIDRSDVHDFFEMRNNRKMHEYTNTPVDKNTEETNAFIDKMNNGLDAKKWMVWAIEHKQSNKVIGSISIWNLEKEAKRGELGYGIVPNYQGLGLMKEALLSVIAYGFDVMKLKILEAYTEENNRSSIKLLESCKFSEIDRVEESEEFSDKVYRMVVYRLEC